MYFYYRVGAAYQPGYFFCSDSSLCSSQASEKVIPSSLRTLLRKEVLSFFVADKGYTWLLSLYIFAGVCGGV